MINRHYGTDTSSQCYSASLALYTKLEKKIETDLLALSSKFKLLAEINISIPRLKYISADALFVYFRLPDMWVYVCV